MEVDYPGLRPDMPLQRALKFNRLPEVSLCCHLEANAFYCCYSLIMAWQHIQNIADAWWTVKRCIQDGFRSVEYSSLLHSECIFTVLPFLVWFHSKVTKTPGLRLMTKEDVPGIHSLLQENLCKFQLSSILSLQEVEHWLLPRENVIDTYVVEVGHYSRNYLLLIPLRGFFWRIGTSIMLHSLRFGIFSPPLHTQGDDGTLTHMVSFYSVSSKVLNHPVHSSLRAAHLLCIVSTGTNLVDLMEDTLILAKKVRHTHNFNRVGVEFLLI